jgi:hypothetical protein
MEDHTAMMQLVLANNQGELSPLERGLHALTVTEKGRHNGKSVKAYAEAVGRNEQTIYGEVQAAEVARSLGSILNFADLINRSTHLGVIHDAPEACWSALVGRLVEKDWTVAETRTAVRAVRDVRAPRGYERYFPTDRLQELAATGSDPTETVQLAVRAIERGRADIREVPRSYNHVYPGKNHAMPLPWSQQWTVWFITIQAMVLLARYGFRLLGDRSAGGNRAIEQVAGQCGTVYLGEITRGQHASLKGRNLGRVEICENRSIVKYLSLETGDGGGHRRHVEELDCGIVFEQSNSRLC